MSCMPRGRGARRGWRCSEEERKSKKRKVCGHTSATASKSFIKQRWLFLDSLLRLALSSWCMAAWGAELKSNLEEKLPKQNRPLFFVSLSGAVDFLTLLDWSDSSGPACPASRKRNMNFLDGHFSADPMFFCFEIFSLAQVNPGIKQKAQHLQFCLDHFVLTDLQKAAFCW